MSFIVDSSKTLQISTKIVWITSSFQSEEKNSMNRIKSKRRTDIWNNRTNHLKNSLRLDKNQQTKQNNTNTCTQTQTQTQYILHYTYYIFWDDIFSSFSLLVKTGIKEISFKMVYIFFPDCQFVFMCQFDVKIVGSSVWHDRRCPINKRNRLCVYLKCL